MVDARNIASRGNRAQALPPPHRKQSTDPSAHSAPAFAKSPDGIQSPANPLPSGSLNSELRTTAEPIGAETQLSAGEKMGFEVRYEGNKELTQ